MDRDSAYRRATQASGAFVALAGVAVLAGWMTGEPILLGLRSNYIPMAPNTALAFIVLGVALIVLPASRLGGRVIAACGAGLVGFVGLLRFFEYAAGREFAVDEWFFHFHREQLGLAPIGKMSLPTAIAFVAASSAVAARVWPNRWKSANHAHAVGVGGLITGMTGLVFSLGYLFSPNAPLLYGTASIPMALNTALCFLCLGVGLTSAAGPQAFPLARLSGPSIRARLLRIFLPLVVGTVGVVAWFTHFLTTTAGSSSAAISAAACWRLPRSCCSA